MSELWTVTLRFGIPVNLEMAKNFANAGKISVKDFDESFPTASGNSSAVCKHCGQTVHGSNRSSGESCT